MVVEHPYPTRTTVLPFPADPSHTDAGATLLSIARKLHDTKRLFGSRVDVPWRFE